MTSATPTLGPTRRFPDGALGPDDQGEVRFLVTHQRGRVVLDFGTVLAWMAMTPAEARGLAALLGAHADAVEEETTT